LARGKEKTVERAHRGVDLVSDVLPFGQLWYDTPDNAIGYAMHYSRSHDAVIRVYDAAGNVIETHERFRVFFQNARSESDHDLPITMSP
jgi:hypothetical protein